MHHIGSKPVAANIVANAGASEGPNQDPNDLALGREKASSVLTFSQRSRDIFSEEEISRVVKFAVGVNTTQPDPSK